MAQLKIISGKKSYNVKGRFTFETNLVEKNGNEEIVVSGALSTHKYLDDITQIESNRYIVKNIKVYNEVFGSEDFNILYNFTADDYEIKGGETNLPLDIEEELERTLHQEDDSLMWE